MNIIFQIIDKNDYINSSRSNKKKDVNSISFLVDRDLSQSDCIKLGTGIEKVFTDIILSHNKNITNIKSKNEKDKKEKDHLFIDENNKVIYYAEIKSNLNLDTEKCKTTYNKCISIKNELSEKYKDYNIKMHLVGARYYTSEIIPKNIKNKYMSIENELFGINEYFESLNVDIKFTEEEYKTMINYIADKMFNEDKNINTTEDTMEQKEEFEQIEYQEPQLDILKIFSTYRK